MSTAISRWIDPYLNNFQAYKVHMMNLGVGSGDDPNPGVRPSVEGRDAQAFADWQRSGEYRYLVDQHVPHDAIKRYWNAKRRGGNPHPNYYGGTLSFDQWRDMYLAHGGNWVV